MSGRWRRAAVAAALVVAVAACSKGSGSHTAAPATPTTTTAPASAPATTAGGTTTTLAPSLAAPCGRTSPPPAHYDHVVVMVEENRTWTGGRNPAVGMGFSATQMPFLHGLATRCSYFTDWTETNVADNSLNQYIGMTSGVANTSTVNDCSPSDSCHSTDDNIFRQVRASGRQARTFVDGATTPCSVGSNAPRHIPALYYWGGADRAACAAEVRPLSELDPSALPAFTYIVPDTCNDGHDCPDKTVDTWARDHLTPILQSATYRAGRTLVVVVYDEDRPVPNLLIAPTAHAGAIGTPGASHAGLLKTIEQALGLPVLQQGQLPAAMSLRGPAHL